MYYKMMALNLMKLRSAIYVRNSLVVQAKLLADSKYFANDTTQKPNLYEVLGISSSATLTEIKKAYYDLTLKYHPDRNENCEIAASKFRAVAEAYEILGNFAFKKKYDQGMPLPLVKKQVKKSYEDQKVEYQKFYDSRGSKTTYDPRSEEINELGRYRETTSGEEFDKGTYKPNNAIEVVIVTYFAALALYTKFG